MSERQEIRIIKFLYETTKLRLKKRQATPFDNSHYYTAAYLLVHIQGPLPRIFHQCGPKSNKKMIYEANRGRTRDHTVSHATEFESMIQRLRSPFIRFPGFFPWKIRVMATRRRNDAI